ncbi:MAG: glycoside hydrolase family 16 protein [Armatimonadetes bacterium]|nr:glycoside hydrolase family 16 protein [Armatimonadota bacterium]
MLTAMVLGMTLAAVPVEDPKRDRKLVWHDEFEQAGAPNPDNWVPEVGKIRNNELQYYTDRRIENAYQNGGQLVIEAKKENFQGSTVTSASLTTRKAWTHVYIEVKAQVPAGKGTWPAIWMLGEGHRLAGDRRVGWPACGEIDIMEYVGFSPDKLHYNIHCQKYNHGAGRGKGIAIDAPGAASQPHVWGLDWRRDRLDFYQDGKKVFTFANEHTGNAAWPYDKPAYLLLNLAIGGSWGGQKGVDDAIFPAKFKIDYVRVYQ